MQIEKVRVHKVNLPFSFDFSHSLRRRSSVRNIVAEVVANQGEITGYGEGAPRSYVTGESQEGAVGSINRFTQKDNFPWDLNDVSQIWDFIDSLSNSKGHNAAICAVETALLDALGKSQSRSVIEYFPHDFYTGTVYYGAVFSLADKQRTTDFGWLVKKMKFGHRHKNVRMLGKLLVQGRGSTASGAQNEEIGNPRHAAPLASVRKTG